MSSVSSMIVTCAVVEDEHDGGLIFLHEWCARLERPIRFGRLDDRPADNGKAMQALVLAAAANYFHEDALLEAFPTFGWLWPEEAVLIVYPEDGPPRIVRADGGDHDG